MARKRLGASVCLGILLVFCTAGAGSTAEPQVPLRDLILEYLTIEDGLKADGLLRQIVSRDDATVLTVTSILQERRSYVSAPVGWQPGQKIAVGARFFEYGLYVPQNYRAEQLYPLIVCLHGAGFTGDAYLERWQARLGDSYILACPTLPHADWWTRTAEELVLATIRAIVATYHVDPNRIFLTGMSNGGIGAYLIGAHHAPRFAGVLPMASGLDNVLMPFLENFFTTPLYIIHGARDQVMPVELSRSIVDVLTALNYTYVYREHELVHPTAGGHFFPRDELGDLAAWLGRQYRNPYPKRLRVVEDASHLLRFGWLRIDATDRIASFTEALVDRQDQAIKARLYARLDATITDNTIVVQAQRVRRYTLFLNDQLIDPTRPIAVTTNGVISVNEVIVPQVQTILQEARVRHDQGTLYPLSVTVDVPGPAQ